MEPVRCHRPRGARQCHRPRGARRVSQAAWSLLLAVGTGPRLAVEGLLDFSPPASTVKPGRGRAGPLGAESVTSPRGHSSDQVTRLLSLGLRPHACTQCSHPERTSRRPVSATPAAVWRTRGRGRA